MTSTCTQRKLTLELLADRRRRQPAIYQEFFISGTRRAETPDRRQRQALSPKSRGRPAGRGRSQRRRPGPLREVRLSDRVLRDAPAIAALPDVLDAER